jgi:hypothetical protein
VRFTLKPDEITLLNPNTGTCPVFRSRRDAEITLGIYRRVPVLIREGDPNGNPWRLMPRPRFHMADDSRLFRTRVEMERDGWKLERNVFVRDEERMLPLYEAKMVHHYDHRWATYEQDGTTRDVTHEENCDPEFGTVPRYWVDDSEVANRIGDRWVRGWLLGWRDICRSTDERTMIAAVFPMAAFGDKLPLVLPSETPWLLQALWSSLVFDYVSRQKIAATSKKLFTVAQLPVLHPDAFEETTAWSGKLKLGDWIGSRIIELSYVTYQMAAFADDLGVSGPPFRWDDGRRMLLRAELDAAFFHLYGIERDDVDYILDTFPIVRRKDERRYGEYQTKRLILEIYDAMAKAMATGEPYRTILDPSPGHGPRHTGSGSKA